MIKICFIALSAMCLFSCAYNKDMQAFENGKKAVVVGGCSFQYTTRLFETDKKSGCEATWENNQGDRFSINKEIDIAFVNPGTYEFVGYKSNTSPRASYRKYPGSISVFSKISIQSGEVIYLGNLDIDSRHTRHLLKAITLSQDLDQARIYMKAHYPTLADKMRPALITFSKKAEEVKKVFNEQ